MANSHKTRFNYAKRIFAKRFGVRTSIYSVDYAAEDQTPTLLRNQMYFIENQGPQFAQAPLPNVSFYCIHGDFNMIEPGNVLVPLENTTSLPTLTCLSRYDLGEIVGFRTDRIGSIYDGEELIYSNIRWCPTSEKDYPENSLARQLRTSPKVTTGAAVLYKRALRTSTFDTEGLLFVETDVTPNVTWKILQTSKIGNLIILTMEISRDE